MINTEKLKKVQGLHFICIVLEKSVYQDKGCISLHLVL